MIVIPPPVSPCAVKNGAASSNSDTVSTGASPASADTTEKQRSSSTSLPTGKHLSTTRTTCVTTCPSTPQRRSIFNKYWQKNSSSYSFKDDDNSSEGSGGRETKRSPRFEPSYLGVYSFLSSPLLTPKPLVLSPVSSTDSLAATPACPKSILKRHRSLTHHRPPLADARPSRPRSVSCTGPESNSKLQFNIPVPPLFNDDASKGSDLSNRGPLLDHQQSFVHFNPTITVRECVGQGPKCDSNWFSEQELKSFMAETVNHCQSSAMDAISTYSLPSVKKCYESAHEAGVKKPILSSHSEYRALFTDPVLLATEEDVVVHDGSKHFFKMMSKEIRRVLIVDNSPMSLKLFHKRILSMFPHVQIDTSVSGRDALNKIHIDPKRGCVNYDLIIVEERLHTYLPREMEDFTGSELLRLINELESSASSERNCIDGNLGNNTSRRSLKIGVSVSLGEDCESLTNMGGADVFWSKPPPKPSNALRNQVLNALLSKRGKSIFICGG